MLADENISARFVIPTVAASVDIVVQVGVEVGGGRRVREIVAVTGRVEADVIETEPIFVTAGGRLKRVQGMPPRLERFAARGVDIHGLLAQPSGMTADSSARTAQHLQTPVGQVDGDRGDAGSTDRCHDEECLGPHAAAIRSGAAESTGWKS